MRKAILWNVLVGAIVALIAQKFGYSPMWGFLGSFIFAVFQLIWLFISALLLTIVVMVPLLGIILTWLSGHQYPHRPRR